MKTHESVDKYLYEALESNEGYYVGLKNTDVIPLSLSKALQEKGYIIHTLDKMAKGGRAIDIELINPITGRWMTGSSSGTAINVFKSINDIGIGTDGGGSVLAPALALNLYAMISPLFEKETLRKHFKASTDGIGFTPSLGFMTRDIDLLETIVTDLYPLENQPETLTPIYMKSPINVHQTLNDTMSLNMEVIESLSYDGLNRKDMMAELSQIDFDKQILITVEGPVDYFEYGDSVMGHYDEITKEKQRLGHKYYLKVINMLDLSAIIVPTQFLSRGYLIIFKSDYKVFNQAFALAKQIKFTRSTLEQNYFKEKR